MKRRFFSGQYQMILWIAVFAAMFSLEETKAQYCSSWLSEQHLGVPGVIIDDIPGTGYVDAATVWDPDGSGSMPSMLVIGGQFTMAGTQYSADGYSLVAAWDGTDWFTITSYFGVIYTLTVFDGKLIIGGSFTGNLAGFKYENSNFVGFNVPTFSNYVKTLCVYGSKLYIGGSFQSLYGQSGNAYASLASWDGNTNLTVSAVGYGTNGTAFAMAVYSGELHVAGDFAKVINNVSGVPVDLSCGNIAKWNGTAWTRVGSSTSNGTNSTILTLHVHDDTKLYAGGAFSAAGGQAVDKIACWNGSSWAAVGLGVGSSTSSVLSLTTFDGELIVAGDFSTVVDSQGQYSAGKIASWNESTSRWSVLDGGVQNGSFSVREVSALALFDGDLIAGGAFVKAGDVDALSIARWNGSSWSRLCSGLNNEATAFAVYQNELIIAGEFTTAGDADFKQIARWDGSNWYPLGDGISGDIHAMIVYADELIVAGNFSLAVSGNVTATNIARWNGSAWSELGSGTGGTVYALGVYNGDLIVGGSFSSAGGATRNSIARWHPTNGWNGVGSGTSGSVHAITEFEGDLVVGGLFASFGGTTAANIARGRLDGSTWDWDAIGNGLGSRVNALLVYDDRLFAGGEFDQDGFTVAWWDPNFSGGPRWRGFASDAITHALEKYTYLVYNIGTDTLEQREAIVMDGLFTINDVVHNMAVATMTSIIGLGMASESSYVKDLQFYRGEVYAGGGIICRGEGTTGSCFWGRWSAMPYVYDGPESLSKDCLNEAAFIVQANGLDQPFTYQWRHNGTNLQNGGPISGATTATLQIQDVTSTNEGDYDCIVSGYNSLCQKNVTKSEVATLTVDNPADFDGDGFLTGLDYDLYVYAFEEGEPESDLDGDGFVDGDDFDIFTDYYENGC